jgi:hypothetical protein
MEGVQVMGLSPDRKVVMLNFCLRTDDEHDGCAVTVFGPDALAWYVETRAGHAPPALYDPDPPPPVVDPVPPTEP